MAVANGVSLIGVTNRLIAKGLQKQAVTRRKFAGGPEGFVSIPGPGPGFPGPSGPGFPGPVITTTFPRGPITPRPSPLVPGPRTDIGDQRGRGGVGGIAELGCDLLSGTARDICLLGAGFLPGGPGGGGDACPPGMARVGKTCIDLTALPPGGDPAFTPTLPTLPGGATMPTGQATVGAFGLPALTPQGVSRVVRKCGRGMVLGIDNLCYPKAVLTARSKFRKWRRPPRAPVTRRDVVAIRRAAGARDRVLELAKDVGLSVTKTKRKKTAKHHAHK